MKLRTLAYAGMIGCALGATGAGAQREARELNLQQNPATTLHAFVEKWQQRIITQNLSTTDPQNWGARNLPKFASFSADRLQMAMQATTLGEVESLLVTAPISNGTRLKSLMTAKPGNISFDALNRTGAVTKSNPTGSPGLYDDLMFTVLSPCRMFDSRTSQGGAGPFVNGVSQLIKIGPYPAAGGGFATGGGAQGGAASGCGLDTLSAGDGIAAVMVAVSSFSQTATGYLTFFPSGAADPSATVVSMFYTAGPVQTAFVLIPTDMAIPVWARGVSRGANTEVTIDVVGYFETPKALECAEGAYETFTLPTGFSSFHYTTSVCNPGMVAVSSYCYNRTNPDVYMTGSGTNGGAWCGWRNLAGVPVDITQNIKCCKLPGGR